MKKMLCLVMAAALSFSLSACNDKNEPETTEAQTTEALMTETEAQTEDDLTTDATQTATEAVTESGEATEPVSGETTSEAVSEAAGAPKTTAEVLDYFNTVINKVKPDSKKIVQNYVLNTQATDLVLGKAKSLEGLANSLIRANMGYVEAANNRVMTSRADKDAFFPVEGMTYGSKLTANDIKSAACTEKNGVYTITIQPKDDAPSASTVKGYGHVGKAMSVVTVSSITDNAGGAKGIIKNIKTGHRNAKIVVTVDAATGNVKHANYYFVWDLCLTADIVVLSVDLTVSFGIEQDYDISW